MTKHASNLREVSYREPAPFPPRPPRRLTKEQKSEANSMRLWACITFFVLLVFATICSLTAPWAHIWPDYWHVVILLGGVLVGSVVVVAWSTWRLWRDETLGGGE